MHVLLARLRLLPPALATIAADILSPATCAACDDRVVTGAVFCVSCEATLVKADGFDGGGVLAAHVFGGAVATALRRLKYESRPELAEPLGRLLRRVVIETGVGGDVVVPVPLHPKRLAERGYNQAALLARPVARARSIPLAARALLRMRHTPQQAHLGRQERLGNVVQAFRVRDCGAVRGRRVLLVDDVVTTGSTLAACATALLDAGATSVQALTVAQAQAAGEPA